MKLNLTFIVAVLCSILSLTTTAQKKTLPDGVTENTSVEGITEYQLSNGMRVLLFPDQSKPTITVNVTYLVGSRHEAYGETGMAHLLEHLVFKGTPNHPDIPAELTEHGCRPNGTTWYDRTNYYETFSASEENLNWALDMESDRMVNSYIAKKDLDSEMTVVRNEYESGENSPGSVLMKRVMGTAFAWHNYGKSTIGERSDLENVPIDRLQAFYKRYYQPDNSVLLVAGKIDEAKTLEKINDTFGKIPKPTRELIPTYTKEPTQDGSREVTLRRVGDVQAVSCVYHTAPGPHNDYAAIAVIDEVLTNEPSGRLYKSLVESKKASYQWGFAPALKEGGFFYMNADVRKENSLDDAKNTMIATLDDIVTNPPSKEELDRAKSRILKNWELAYNSSDRVGLRLSEYIAQGDWRLFFLFRDRIEAIEIEQVAAAAKKYFVPSNRTIGLFIPEENAVRAEIPSTPNVNALLASYKGKEAISVGEAFDPSPDNIDTRTVKGSLDSGLDYAILTKENRGDAVVGSLKLRFGSPSSVIGKSVIGDLTASMLDKGTENMNRQAIQDKLDALKARVRIYGGKTGVTARIETTHDNLPEVMDLVGEMFTKPAFTQDEFEKVVEENLAYMEEQLSEPRSIASNIFNRKLSPYPKSDVRYNMTMEEEISAIKATTLDDVKAFYNDVYGASEATLSMVGDFDEKLMNEKLAQYFGTWKNPSKYVRITEPYIANEVGDVNVNTPDKANAMFYAGMNLPIGQDHPDYPALVLGNYMLGGGFLNSRLATRIRQKDGLSYGVGSWLYANNQDESGGFGAYAIYAPENRDKVQAAFKEEIEKMVMDGFTQEEIDAAKSGWLQSQEVTRSQDASLAGKLGDNLRLDRTMAWDKNFEDKVNKLTMSDINKAMAKHIKLDKMVYVKAGDFEKTDKTIKP